MRFLDLHLDAFGPFTGLELDFAQRPDGKPADGQLAVVYGRNEAGKSSALRAVKALLYGIEQQSSDNFRHEYSKMRIGAHLQHSDGAETRFTRRKGRKDTLLDPAGKPLPDNALERFLAGVTESMFSNAFGIDHDALIRGGQDILEGKGDVAESLFSAGLGGTRLRRIFNDLEEERRTLFVPGGQRKINQAISAYGGAKRQVQESSLSGREWSEHDAAHKDAQDKLVACEEELRGVTRESMHLERLRTALPKIAKRKRLLIERHEMGRVALLPATFSEERRGALEQLRAAEQQRREADGDLDRLKNEASALAPSQPLLDEAASVADLQERLGSYKKAQRDIVGLRARHENVTAKAAEILAELRPGASIEEAARFRLSASHRARILELGQQHTTFENELARIDKEAQKRKRERSTASTEMNRSGSVRDPGELRRVAAHAQKQGDLDAALEEARSTLAADEQQAGVELKRLGLWNGRIEDLDTLVIPSVETVDDFAVQIDALESERRANERAIAEMRGGLREVTAKLDALCRAGSVPTEEHLDGARERRERGWQLVRRAWLDREDVAAEARQFDPDNELPGAYERTVSHADEVADRLRREANRVAHHAELSAQQQKLEEDLKTIEEDSSRTACQLEEKQDAWVQLWRGLDIEPRSPKEMRTWSAKLAKVVQRAEDVRRQRTHIEQIECRILAHRQALSRALESMGEPGADGKESLATLLVRAQEIVTAITDTNRSRKELEASVAKIEEDLETLAAEREKTSAVFDRWLAEWADAMKLIGLPENAVTAQAHAVLARVEDLFKNLDEAHELTERIQGIEHDGETFACDVRQLAQAVGPDLEALSPDNAVVELGRRLTTARREATLLEEMRKQARKREDDARKAKSAMESATAKLEALCRQAGCATHEELPRCEERSVRFKEIEKDIQTLEDNLLELSQGAALEPFCTEAEQHPVEALEGEIATLSRQRDTLEEERKALLQHIGSEKTLLRQMDGSDKAAAAAEQLQDCAAVLREHVDRYVVLSAGATILKREIQRYRTENQGPVLSRASQLFQRLTAGKFDGVQTDFGDRDEHVLLGLRASGETVRVEGMSDGTRDQLYLSLRLATLERYLGANEPMPFIVDDILIRFDDQRAEATLDVLAELAGKTQILFFTHHARLADLMKTPAFADRAFVRELNA